MDFLLTYKIFLINLKRAITPIIIMILGMIFLIFSLVFIEGGKKIIRSSPTVIGDNRVLVKGKVFTEKDIKLLENYPFVDYVVFPKAQVLINDNLYIGYPEKIFSILNLPIPREKEVILDKKQFSNIEQNQIIDLEIGNNKRSFLVRDLYKEKNPFELKKEGKRVLMLQKTFEEVFEKNSFDEMVICFNRKDEVEKYIPIILNKFEEDRGLYGGVEIIKAPEVYSKTEKIQEIVGATSGILSFIFLVFGSIGFKNIIKGNLISKKENGKIRKIKNLNYKYFPILLIYEALLIISIVVIIGLILGTLFANILSDIYMLYSAFKIKNIVIAIFIIYLIGVIIARQIILKHLKK